MDSVVISQSTAELQIYATTLVAIVSVIGSIVIVWMQTRAATKVREVKETLEIKDKKDTKVLRDIHTLVNSNMGIQLKLVMDLTEDKANKSHKEEDIEAAKLARIKYEEHVERQKIVNGKSELESRPGSSRERKDD